VIVVKERFIYCVAIHMSRKYQRKSGIVWLVKERNLRDNMES
jgi:hypothetical protein